ncbi:MAG: hypothetical protein ABI700_12115 [Chloroflexota bacterium]
MKHNLVIKHPYNQYNEAWIQAVYAMIKSWFARFALIICLISSSAFSCSLANFAGLFLPSNIEVTPTVEASQTNFNTAIHEVLHTEEQAFNHKNLDAYMATMHPDSPGYAGSEAFLQSSFVNYDLVLKVSLGDATLLDNGDASIPFVITTKKLHGGAFRDNEITGNFIMRLDGSQWKLYNQEILNIRYL